MLVATFVLVHCGFAAGWIWREVATRLRQSGHEVFTPTLTGLGERAHLAHPDVDLDTHIQDVVGVFECEDLHNVILVGSSSGSLPITGVAERIPERIRQLIYLDTLVPQDGESWMDLLTPAVAAPLLEAAQNFGDGWRVPLLDHEPPRWVPHPLKSVTQPVTVGNSAAMALPRIFIHCTDTPADWFFGLASVIAAHAAWAKAQGWTYRELHTDHLPMLSAPQELSAMLHDLAVEVNHQWEL
jgi:pimeloyl-ACP methyl ester carboxylesterase